MTGFTTGIRVSKSTRMINAPLKCYAALWIFIAVIATACSDAREPQTMSVRAALTLPADANITSLTYAALSSSGATLDMGTIAISDPNAIVSLNLMLPPGSGDVVKLAATTSAGTSCTGRSAPFDVVTGAPTSVSLSLVCGDRPQSASCPEIQAWTVSPQQAVVPDGTVTAQVTVAEADATQPLSYSWIATAGILSGVTSDTSGASTTYTCTTVGSQSLMLTVTAGTPPLACATTAVFVVDCLASGAAAPSP
jgi:hypothetical protein